MDAHRVQILNRADDDDVVRRIAHDLHLVLFPAENGFFQQHFTGGRQVQPIANLLFELFAVVSHTAACTTQRKAGSDNDRQADVAQSFTGFVHVVNDGTLGTVEADLHHGLFERVTFFGLGNDLLFRAQQLNTKLVEDAASSQIHRGVQTGLAAQRR